MFRKITGKTEINFFFGHLSRNQKFFLTTNATTSCQLNTHNCQCQCLISKSVRCKMNVKFEGFDWCKVFNIFLYFLTGEKGFRSLFRKKINMKNSNLNVRFVSFLVYTFIKDVTFSVKPAIY